MFKKFTEQDVQDAIIELIEQNETATALDVKKSLRKNGFWALQGEISKTIRDNYSKWGLEKEDNGVFNTYSYATSEEYDEDDLGGIFGCCATSGQLNPVTTDEGEDEVEDEIEIEIEPEPVKKLEYGKVIEEPKMLFDDTYQLVITPLQTSSSDEAIKLVVSNNKKLSNVGPLVYEVRTGKDNWYLYSEDPNVITRHKAIYYVWRVVSQEYDGFLAYADLRSTKLWR